MNIEEAIRDLGVKKKMMEQSIRQAIQNFENETGVCVNSISVDRTSVYSVGRQNFPEKSILNSIKTMVAL